MQQQHNSTMQEEQQLQQCKVWVSSSLLSRQKGERKKESLQTVREGRRRASWLLSVCCPSVRGSDTKRSRWKPTAPFMDGSRIFRLMLLPVLMPAAVVGFSSVFLVASVSLRGRRRRRRRPWQQEGRLAVGYRKMELMMLKKLQLPWILLSLSLSISLHLVWELMTRFWSCWANGSIDEGPATQTQRGRMWSFFIAAEIPRLCNYGGCCWTMRAVRILSESSSSCFWFGNSSKIGVWVCSQVSITLLLYCSSSSNHLCRGIKISDGKNLQLFVTQKCYTRNHVFLLHLLCC
jgi:hypothetical protein